MKWLGLTGGIASGKSTVARWLQDEGLVVVDADQLAREVVEPGEPAYLALIQHFSQKILKNGKKEVDRAKLGSIVFNDPDQLKALEEIVHPEVRKKVERKKKELIEKNCDLVFYMVPLLFEKEMQSDFDGVVVVSCSEEQQLKRLMSRDGLSEQEAMSRIRAQLPIDEKISMADWVLENRSSMAELKEQVVQLTKEI